jgi:Carboxypeptidase regulatory-like domain
MVGGNKFKVMLRTGFVFFLVAAVGTPVLLAQVTSGTIACVVADQTGGIIAGSTVTVRHLKTNATRTAVTESDGRYTFPGLPVGPYELTVETPGFARYVRSGIFLLLNQAALVNP